MNRWVSEKCKAYEMERMICRSTYLIGVLTYLPAGSSEMSPTLVGVRVRVRVRVRDGVRVGVGVRVRVGVSLGRVGVMARWRCGPARRSTSGI